MRRADRIGVAAMVGTVLVAGAGLALARAESSRPPAAASSVVAGKQGELGALQAELAATNEQLQTLLASLGRLEAPRGAPAASGIVAEPGVHDRRPPTTVAPGPTAMPQPSESPTPSATVSLTPSMIRSPQPRRSHEPDD